MLSNSRQWLACTTALACIAGCTAATAIRRGYEIHTADLTCDEANRLVQDALVSMNMEITDFRLAKPGRDGRARGSRKDSRGTLSGTVDIRCDDDGVHIVPDQSGIVSGQDFERGVFLSVTGQAGLTVEREGRYTTGKLGKKKQPTTITSARAEAGTGVNIADSPPAPPATVASSGTVTAEIEPQRGFATVLDFEANISAVGILPVKVTIANGSARAYDFDPRDIVLRKTGSRDRAEPMTARQAVSLLQGGNQEVVAGGGAQDGGAVGPVEPTAASELGDVAAASRIIPERELKPARLAPGQSVTGYLYFPLDDYDRARVTMIDVATGETEGFLVEF